MPANRVHYLVVLPALLSLGILANIACKGSGSTSASTPTPSPTPSPSPTPLPVGVIEEEYFYVQAILPSNVPYYFHEQSSLTSKCRIAASETVAAKKDIYCILDINELDLRHVELKLNFNSPTTLCPYVRVAPYWFYEWEPAPLNMVRTASVHVVNSSSTVITQPVQGDVFISSTGSVTTCQYDHSASSGPNCCEGSLTVMTQDDTIGVTTVTTAPIGGKRNACMAGPALDFLTTATGAPMIVDYYTDKIGINDVLTLKAPSEVHMQNHYRANYFKPTSFGNSSDIFPFTGGNVPKGIKSTDGGLHPNAYYQFICTDRASDYLNRIRVLIRSWDTISGLSEYTDPYNSDQEGLFPEEKYHDFSVWSDFATDYPGAAGRDSYFGMPNWLDPLTPSNALRTFSLPPDRVSSLKSDVGSTESNMR